MPRESEETVSAYADPSGRWHARIDIEWPGYGNVYLPTALPRLRRKARNAIRKGLAERQGQPLAPVRVEVTRNGYTSANQLVTITFSEK